MSAFADPDLGVFSSRLVMEEGEPVLLVFHDENGDWQFLSSNEEHEDQIVLVHISHLLDRDSALHGLSDLPLGWKAWRETPEDEWVREPTPADQPYIEEA